MFRSRAITVVFRLATRVGLCLPALGVLAPDVALARSPRHRGVAPPNKFRAQSLGPQLRPLRLDLGLTASHFQQQAKTEIGGERGDRLVEQTEIGVASMFTYRLLDALHAGLFTQFDYGTRSAGRFETFAGDGATETSGQLGGDYAEWWLGPLVRAQYRRVFFEVGWAALGLRWDEGRNDIVNNDQSDDGAFATTPSVAWLLALGGSVPLARRLDLALRLEYRVRYYESRGGEPLFDNSALGSQNLTPFVGIAWYP